MDTFDLSEKTLSSKYVYDGKIIKLRVDDVQLPNERITKREVIEHPGGVAVIPIDEELNTYIVEQFRTGAKEILREIPAGKLEYGEDPFECGTRELHEEVGLLADNYTYLGYIIPTPAYCEEKIHMYLAENLSKVNQNLDDNEFLNVKKIKFNDVYQMVINNEITDAKTVVAILKTKQILDSRLK